MIRTTEPGASDDAGSRAALPQRLIERPRESVPEGESTDHLGSDERDPASRNGGNSRNGNRSETVPPDADAGETAAASTRTQRPGLRPPSGSPIAGLPGLGPGLKAERGDEFETSERLEATIENDITQDAGNQLSEIIPEPLEKPTVHRRQEMSHSGLGRIVAGDGIGPQPPERGIDGLALRPLSASLRLNKCRAPQPLQPSTRKDQQ